MSPAAQPAPDLDAVAVALEQDGAWDQKRLATAQARAARTGHELRQVPSGFVLQRGTHSQHVGDFESVLALLSKLKIQAQDGSPRG